MKNTVRIGWLKLPTYSIKFELMIEVRFKKI